MAAQTERHPRLLRLIALGDGTHGVETLSSAMGVAKLLSRLTLAKLSQPFFFDFPDAVANLSVRFASTVGTFDNRGIVRRTAVNPESRVCSW